MEKGKLKIYFSYSEGCSKHLNLALDALDSNEDIVISSFNLDKIKEHDLLNKIDYLKDSNGDFINKFNFKKVLYRHPKIVIIDNLFDLEEESNTPIYNFIDSLIENNISVWTTLNVFNLEGENDLIKEKFNISITEKVPDIYFNNADEVISIDHPYQKTLDNLSKENNFKYNEFVNINNLTILRELALSRFVNYEINKENKDLLNKEEIKPILVLISSSPNSQNLLRVASNLALKEKTRFLALYVSNANKLSKNDEKMVEENIDLAKKLGGEVLIKFSLDIIEALRSFIKINSVGTIIIGKSFGKVSKNSIENKIVSSFPELEILIIPFKNVSQKSSLKRKRNFKSFSNFALILSLVLLIVSLVTFIYNNLIGGIISLISIFILSFSVAFMFTKEKFLSKKLSVSSNLLDSYSLILSNLRNNYGDEKSGLLAQSLSQIFNKSVFISINNEDYSYIYKDEDISSYLSDEELDSQSIIIDTFKNSNSSIEESTKNAIYFKLIKNNKYIGFVSFITIKGAFSSNEKLEFYDIKNFIEELI